VLFKVGAGEAMTGGIVDHARLEKDGGLGGDGGLWASR
jgi:hypothetical protein